MKRISYFYNSLDFLIFVEEKEGKCTRYVDSLCLSTFCYLIRSDNVLFLNFCELLHV